ncbi:Stringent starvation protein B [Rickettsiales bacterium Ac37b]|nr:Stringent starvation protein B [Rickettsiales bacterium Ac37b]
MADIINYSSLIDDAMRVIVKKSLEILASTPANMIGDHHFFISFITTHPKVVLSSKLLQKYPKEMTIVLQYQFEDLHIEEDHFSVILSFENAKERIVIPFTAITAFADPSVKFGLQFRHAEPSSSDEISHSTDLPINGDTNYSTKDIKDMIKESGATNVITLDSFRKKPH